MAIIWLFRQLERQNPSIDLDSIDSRRGWGKCRLELVLLEFSFLALFLATKETLALLANDSIMLKRLIRLFRHLERHNPSFILDSID